MRVDNKEDNQSVGKLETDNKLEKLRSELSETRKALQEVKQEYRTFFEYSGTAMAIFDEDTTISRVNKGFEELSGYKKEEVEGKMSWTDFVHPDDVEMMRNYHHARRRGEEAPNSYEFQFIDRDGHIKNVYIVTDVIPAKKSVVSLIDITERKKRSKEYKQLIDGMNDTVFVINFEEEFIEVNDTAVEVLGYSREELLSMGPKDIDPFLSTKEISELIEGMRMGEKQVFETQHMTKEGNKIPVEISSSLVTYQGELAILSIARDITKRLKAEEALRESEEKFRAITSSAKDAIIMMDERGKVNYWNKAAQKIFGYTSNEIKGKSIFHITEGNQVFIQEFREVRKTGKEGAAGKTLELSAFRKDGSEIPVELSLSAVKVDGRWNTVAIVRDITERKKDEERISQLNEILRLINKTLRHDILNDLNVVSNYMEIYREVGSEEYLKKAFNSIEKSVNLIREMKELESIVPSDESLKPYNIKEVAEDVLNKYNVEFNVESGDCSVLADEGFTSVIDNVVRNAVDHGNADKINVRVKCGDSYCEIIIADNGKGIPHDLKDRVLEEGFSGGSGTGLGLYIVKKTVERYGGGIKVEDNSPQGTTIILRLPSSTAKEVKN